jgi:parallel beta-helix repeat protein
MSCTADATNFEGCRGTVVMENCLFEGQGDDATNVRSGEYLLVDDRLSDTRLKIKHGYTYTSGIPQSPQVGDILEISSSGEPLLPYAKAAVRSVEVIEKDNALIVEFTEKLPEKTQKGDIVGNASSCPVLRIRNCTAVRNRARGFIIKTRDVIIEDCTLQDICASAVGLEADVNAWWEAIGSGNVVIRNNRFIRCKFEPEYLNGVIESHTMSQTTPAGVHRNITIENNIFSESDGNMIKLGSADDVKITGNIMDSPREEAILLYNSKNILISKNKLTNCQVGLRIGKGCDTMSIRMEDNIGF